MTTRRNRTAAAPTVHELITCYEYAAVPEDHPDRRHVVVRVEYRGWDTWAVTTSGSPTPCLSASGEWTFEPPPSERTKRWIAEHRFPLATARRLARQAAAAALATALDSARAAAEFRADLGGDR
jgi:hypothetical protein